ncbi:MAG: undecaprenyl-phosphate galactose phosphotransferase WbaP [Chloroflexota bacterium]|nr:MAG: undecaprenyl-phosphate galactose phosphotransferase WbaP [Chloroflexota bacterium]
MEVEVKRFLSESKAEDHGRVLTVNSMTRIQGFSAMMILIFSDLTCILAASLFSVGLQLLIRYKLVVSPLQIGVFIFLCIIAYALYGLYSRFSISPVVELKKLTISTSLIFLVILVESFWFTDHGRNYLIFLALIWGGSLLLLPLGRSITRAIRTRIGFNGEPTVIIGSGKVGRALIRHLMNNPMVGLHPVAMIDFSPSLGSNEEGDLPIFKLSDPTNLQSFSRTSGIKTAIMVLSECPPELLREAAKIEESGFRRMVFIPNEQEISNLGIKTMDLGSVSGLKVEWSLFSTFWSFIKRSIDIILVLSGGLLIAPMLIMLGLIVKIDSNGSIFYGHTRIGKGKKKFKAWKFRTMVPNADKLLQEYLEKDPDLRKEWESSYKLRKDPRITRVGRILRKLSLDELPQIWNVLVGEMSLVGPRPIIEDEIKCYGDVFDMYALVKPGMSGLWQVSGRNDTSYDYRVQLDKYYISNWSIWLDLYILALTIKAAFIRKGAY